MPQIEGGTIKNGSNQNQHAFPAVSGLLLSQIQAEGVSSGKNG